jgi:uncharacterized DUF497 family protein
MDGMYIQIMKFVWNELKNRENIRKHGIDFKDAAEIFSCPMLTNIDNRHDYGEERWVGIGFMKGIITVIVYTENDDKNIIRLISARKATKNENQRFKETIGY